MNGVSLVYNNNKMYLTTTNRAENIQTAKEILNSLNVQASYSGYSDSNGISVYFKTMSGHKIRVSDHSVSNYNRLMDEIHFQFDERQLGLSGKVSFKSNTTINKLVASKIN